MFELFEIAMKWVLYNMYDPVLLLLEDSGEVSDFTYTEMAVFRYQLLISYEDRICFAITSYIHTNLHYLGKMCTLSSPKHVLIPVDISINMPRSELHFLMHFVMGKFNSDHATFSSIGLIWFGQMFKTAFDCCSVVGRIVCITKIVRDTHPCY